MALLHLLALAQLLLDPTIPLPLQALRAALGIKHVVPPSETRRVVANELLMMRIVVIRAGPEWQEMVQRPREFVSGVRINGLEEPQNNPNIHCENVQVLRDRTPQDWRSNSTKAKTQDFNRTRVLGGQAKWRRVLVMNLVDVFVKEWPSVHGAVRPVMPGVFHDEEDCDLIGHGEN